MKRLVYLLMLWLPLAGTVTAEEQIIWLDGNLSKVDGEAEARYKVLGREKIEGGYHVVIRYPDGAPYLKTNITGMDFPEIVHFGEYSMYYQKGSLYRKGQLNGKGIPDGLTTDYFPNGNVATEISFSEGQRHGLTTRYHRNGHQYMETHYQKGKRHGTERIWIHDGVLDERNEYRQGQLVEHESFDSNGKPMSYHRYDRNNGAQLEERNYDHDGRLIEKKFHSRNRYGPIETHEEYSNDGSLLKRVIESRDQKWTLKEAFSPDGELSQRSEYLNGQPIGMSLHTLLNGDIAKRHFRQGKLHGEHRVLSADGEILSEGMYQHGHKTGQWIDFNDDRNIIRETFDQQGRRQGERRIETPEGILLQRQHYQDGVKHGPYERWSDPRDHRLPEDLPPPRPQLQARGNYHNGERHGRWFLAEPGVLMVGELQGDLRRGEWRGYSLYSSVLMRITPYNDKGRIHGRTYTFSARGALEKIAHYDDGVMSADVWIYKQSKLHERQHYEAGNLVNSTPAEDIPEEQWP